MKLWLFVFISFLSFSCTQNGNESSKKEDVSKRQLIDRLKDDIKKYPDSAGLRMRLVNSYDSLKFYKEAISQTDSLIKRDSLNNGLWFTKGQLQEDSGDTSAA